MGRRQPPAVRSGEPAAGRGVPGPDGSPGEGLQPKAKGAAARAGVVLVDGGGSALPRVSGSLLDGVSPVTPFQGVRDNVRMAASNVLVALARMHFSLVMAELQGQLKAIGERPKDFVLITLSKLFGIYGRVLSATLHL